MFILGLDAPVKPETILAHAHCVAAGVNEEIGVRLVTGSERKTILDNRKSFAASYLRVLLVDGEGGRTRGFIVPVARDRQRQRQIPAAARRARLAAGDARLRAHAARRRRSEAGVGQGDRRDVGCAHVVGASAGVPGAADVSRVVLLRARQQGRAMHSDPAAHAFVHGADRQGGRVDDSPGRCKARPSSFPAKVAKRERRHPRPWTFGPGLPERQQFRLELPANLKDDAGRALANAHSFPLKVGTDENPPLAKFAADFGILERVLPGRATPMLPVTLRNVEPVLRARGVTIESATREGETMPGHIARVAADDDMKIVEWLQRIEAGNRIEREYDQEKERWTLLHHGAREPIMTAADRGDRIAVPKPNGRKAFEVVGIPLPLPGFYVVELASPKLGASLLGESKPFYVRAAALVTNLSVHFKLGRESSLVWVTRLSDGKPVANARVAVRDCGGNTHWEGRSDSAGIARVAKALPQRRDLPECADRGRREYFVTAHAGDDMAYAFSDWGEGISPWRFNVPTGSDSGPFIAHAVLDRNLVRTGDTVSMKLFVRKQVGQGFALVPRAALEDTLSIRHQGSDKKYEVPVHWSGASLGEASFAVPKDGELGTYAIYVRDSLADAGRGRSRNDGERLAGKFRVEAFRVPLMRARLQAVGTPLVAANEAQLDVQVNYLAGGGAGGLPVKLRTQTESKVVSFADYENFSFAAGNVREGREEQGESVARTGSYVFADPDMEGDDDDNAQAPAGRQGARDMNLTLDASGGIRATMKDLGTSDTPRDLVAELEYRDPNGETLTAATRVPLWTSQVVLGLKPDGWASSKERLKFTMLALDTEGRPLAGVRIRSDAFKRVTYSHRRRLIGGFYAYEHGSETTRIGELCEGDTDAHGVLICEVAAPAAGNLILRAQAADAQGRAAVTRAEAWVVADEDGGSPRPTTIASISCRRKSNTSRAIRRAFRCARRSRRPRFW